MTGKVTSSTRSISRFLVCLSVSLFSCWSVPDANRKGTIDIPEGSTGIVAYGSLMSLPSMEQTLGHKYRGSIRQVHLTGYERAWECVRPFNDPRAPSPNIKKINAYYSRGNARIPFLGTAELNIHPRKKGRINAILYVISNTDMSGFDKREWGYRRVDVTDQIEEFRFRSGRVYAYEGLPARTDESPPTHGAYVLIREFADMVTSACDAIGKTFRDEFDRSTKPWVYPIVSFKEMVWEPVK